QTGRGDPDQTRRAAGDPVPRTRRDPTAPAEPAEPWAARAARSGPDPVPLQHWRPCPRGRRPTGRAPRPRRAAHRDAPRHGRHTAAVHLLEAGVEVNVIRGWLGHADLTTTNRYADINTPLRK